MRRIRRIFLYGCIVCSLFLTACWNYRDVDQLTIALGVAIDKTGEGKYLITVEAADMHEAGQEGKVKSALIESEGETVFDAARNAINKNSPKIYWGHATTVIISQKIAREGVADVIDFFYRDAEPRLSMELFVSECETAKEIFDAKSIGTEIRSTEISDILKDQRNLSKAVPVQIHRFISAMKGEGKSPVMPSVCLEEREGEKILKLCGTAVFKNDRLLGFLNEDETKSLNFVLDNVNGGILVARTGSGADEGRIAMEMLQCDTKIKPVCSDDKISMEVGIRLKVAIDDYNTEDNFTGTKGRTVLTKLAEEQLKQEIESVVRKVQKTFNSDIFCFGNCIYRNDPELWKKYGKDWDVLFRDLEVSVKPVITIEHSGLLSKPIKKGD